MLDLHCDVSDYHSKECWSGISLGGSVEIQLQKTWRVVAPKGGASSWRGGGIREKERFFLGDCILDNEYVGFWRGIGDIILSPSLNLNCFPNACCNLVPDIEGARGLRVKYVLVSFFPKL
jgi:hypothetical protein